MKKRKALLLVAMVAFAAFALAEDFTIDKVHSQVGFSVKHLMISNVNGRFTDFDGTITYDAKDITRSAVKVTVKTLSITTDNAGRDADLHKSEFLDVEKFPVMTFQSVKVEKRGADYILIGDLTLKGVTKRVEIPFTLSGPITEMRGWAARRASARAASAVSWARMRAGPAISFTRKAMPARMSPTIAGVPPSSRSSRRAE